MRHTLYIIAISLLYLLPMQAGGKRALLIGISEYPAADYGWDDIHGANDVDLLAPTLKKQGFVITSLKNKQATAANIRKAFKQLATSTKKGDLVVVSFSCHGQPVEDLNHDEKSTDGWDESFVSYDAKKRYQKGVYEGQNHIIDDEFNVMLNAIRKKAGGTGFVYVVADACHAGSIYKDDEVGDTVNIIRGTKEGFSKTNKSFSPMINSDARIKIPYTAGYANVCLLEACRDYEFSTEIKRNGKYYGPVSWYVNEVLKGNTLTSNTAWTEKVAKAMEKDTALKHQNLVKEETKK